MRLNLLILLFFAQIQLLQAQPFRYVTGNVSDRDSIKSKRIKMFKEYSAPFSDSTNKVLSRIVEYDTNGNMTRNWWHNSFNESDGQSKWNYDDKNRLIENITFSGDSIHYLQRFLYCFDANGNEIESITENYSIDRMVSISRTTKEYDSKNHLIILKVYANNGLHTHYEYVYNAYGTKTEEHVYSPEGKLIWNRNFQEMDYNEDRMPYGFPHDPDPEMEALLKEEVLNNVVTGEKTISDGYGYRIFNKSGILLKWYEKNFKFHWYVYSYY